MADFSELCPLFNTGVYSEALFPSIPMTTVSTIANALAGTMTATATKVGYWTFGRTVVITDAFIKCEVAPTAAQSLWLLITASGAATATAMSAFATFMMSMTLTGANIGYTWQAMTVTSRTFTSTDVLCLSVGTSTTSGAGTYSLMVRYREK